MIDRCPKCNYALEGLPDVHNCPECGFAYEKCAMEFRLATTSLRSFLWALVAISAGSVLGLSVTFGTIKSGHTRLGFLLLGGISLLVLGIAAWRVRTSLPLRVLLHRDAVVIVGAWPRRDKSIGYDTIGEIRVADTGDEVWIHDLKGDPMHLLPAALVGPTRLDGLCREVDARRASTGP